MVAFDHLPKNLQDALFAEALEEAQAEVEQELQREDKQSLLFQRMVRAYPKDQYPQFDSPEEAYRHYVEVTGNAPDQIRNFERYGIVPLEWQLKFCKAARDADDYTNPNEIGCGGARGPGKSFIIFAQVALDDCVRMPGLSVLYLRNAQKAGKEQMTKLLKAVLGQVEKVGNRKSLDADCGHLQYNYVESPTPTVTFNNGSRIVIGHFATEAEALNYQGVEYDIIIIEETTHLSKKAYTTLGLSNRTDNPKWRPRRYNSTNPLGKGHGWYKKYFVVPERDGTEGEGKTRFFPATVDDNFFVDPDYKDNLEQLKGAQLKAWRFGDWEVSAGAFFENYRYKIHAIQTLNGVEIDKLTAIPPEWDCWMSLDIGHKHWNVFLVHVRDTDGTTYTIKQIAHRKMQPKQIAPDVLSYLDQIQQRPEDLIVFAGGDAFMIKPGQSNTVAQQYMDFGIRLVPAWTQPGSRVDGARYLAELLGDPDYDAENNPTDPPKWYIGDNCTGLLDCLATLEPDPNNGEDVGKVDVTDDGEGGDDYYDAARYGLYIPHMTQVA